MTLTLFVAGLCNRTGIGVGRVADPGSAGESQHADNLRVIVSQVVGMEALRSLAQHALSLAAKACLVLYTAATARDFPRSTLHEGNNPEEGLDRP